MNPILFRVGPLIIYSYGAMVAIAFAVCSLLMWRNAPKAGIDRKKIPDFLLTVLISGIIGARILHVLVNISYYTDNLLEIVMLNRGGLAFHGGIIAATFAGIAYLRFNKMDIWTAGDLIAPYAALGQAIGRTGCFLNGCCYGKSCGLGSIGIMFPGESVYRYPTQIYSTLMLLGIYMILRYMLEKRIMKGDLFLVYLILFSIQRCWIEMFRGDIPQVVLGFTMPQMLSAGVFIIALFTLIYKKHKRPGFNQKN